jgi:hypothetical protein
MEPTLRECDSSRIGALPGLDLGEKINSKPVKQTRGQAAMKTWAIVVGVLIVLFCLSYLVRHPQYG